MLGELPVTRELGADGASGRERGCVFLRSGAVL